MLESGVAASRLRWRLLSIVLVALVSIAGFAGWSTYRFRDKRHAWPECEQYAASQLNLEFASAPLRAALREYEQLHARLVGATGDEGSALDAAERRFLVWRPKGGTANRMLSMVSMLLLSMLTGRAFLVDMNDVASIHEVFCSPPFQWDFSLHISQRGLAGVWSALRMRTMRLTGDGAGPTSAIMHAMACDDFNTAYPDAYLGLRSDLYFVPLLFSNPAFRARLDAWFPDARVAAPMLNYLFRPVDPVMEAVESFAARYFLPDASVLGVQMRSTPVRTCTGRLFSSNGEALTHLRTMLSHCLATRLNVSTSTLIFVASMHAEFKTDMGAHFGHDNVLFVTSQVSDAIDVADMRAALTDIWLLARTHHLIVSPFSTFGYVAQALRQTPSTVLALPLPGSVPEPCDVIRDLEPCFHMNTTHVDKLPMPVCAVAVPAIPAFRDHAYC